MGEENKRNMAEQGGTCLGEIQREGVGGNLFEGDAWHKDKEWRAIGESDSTAKRRGLSLSSELRVRCGPTAEMPDRKQEMASAAMQQLCQGEGGGRGRKEQSREVGATPQLHQHYCSLPEWGRAQCSTLSHVPSSNSKQGCTDANTSTHNLISREAHKSTDWFIKTFQEKY